MAFRLIWSLTLTVASPGRNCRPATLDQSVKWVVGTVSVRAVVSTVVEVWNSHRPAASWNAMPSASGALPSMSTSLYGKVIRTGWANVCPAGVRRYPGPRPAAAVFSIGWMPIVVSAVSAPAGMVTVMPPSLADTVPPAAPIVAVAASPLAAPTGEGAGGAASAATA